MYLFSAKNKVTLPDEVWLAYLENAMYGLQDKRVELKEQYLNLKNEDQNTEQAKQKWLKLENEIKDNLVLAADISGSIEFLNKCIEDNSPSSDTESEG